MREIRIDADDLQGTAAQVEAGFHQVLNAVANRKGMTPTSGDGLATVARMLPTPTAQDGKNNGGPSQKLRHSPPHSAVANGDGSGRPLNPAWVCTMMGFPANWLDVEPLITSGNPDYLQPFLKDLIQSGPKRLQVWATRLSRTSPTKSCAS